MRVETFSRWMPAPYETVLCAVSGGLDSMCLLHVLFQWCREHGGQVCAAHFNHRLRPNADRDETFVRDWCAGQGIPFLSGSGDVRAYARRNGLSIEEAARTMRYAFLRRQARAGDFSRIYTAHHMSDNVETVLLNLIRGTGIRGLSGMSYRRGDICRPFLDVTRPELEAYALRYDIPHVEDETNADPSMSSRNLVRQEVLPLLRRLNPKVEEHIHAAAWQLAMIDDSLERDARARMARAEARDGRIALSVRTLREANEAVRPRILLCALDKLGVGRKDFGSVHLRAILRLTDGADHPDDGRERRLDLPHGVTARCRRGWLILETRPSPLTEIELRPGQSVRWGNYLLTLRENLDRLPEGWEHQGLALRQEKSEESPAENIVTVGLCPPGERLNLRGGTGNRSVKRLCIDHRISLPERDSLPAVYIGGKLAGVWRLGVDRAFIPEQMPCRFVEIRRHTE